MERLHRSLLCSSRRAHSMAEGCCRVHKGTDAGKGTCNGHASQGAISDVAVDLCIAADARQHVCAELKPLQQRWVPLPRMNVHEAGARCVGDISDKDATCASKHSFFAHVTGQY